MQSAKKTISLSTTEVLVLGIEDAGWKELIEHRTNEGKIVYTWENSCLASRDSIYRNSHPIQTELDVFLVKSKSAIVDGIQENIKRYHDNKDLIPIEMVIMSLDEKEYCRLIPDLPSAVDKINKKNQGSGISNAEIRIVYKLMEEIPDSRIRTIMRASFSMLQKTMDEKDNPVFLSLENPWDALQLQEIWKNRNRKNNYRMYKERESELPIWVNKLIEYNKTCASANPNLPLKI